MTITKTNKCQFMFLLASTLLVCSCRGLFEDKEVAGNFHIVALGSKYDMSLGYEINDGGFINIIPHVVFAVGYNEKYIIAKQHPLDIKAGLNKKVTNYYIIPVSVKDQYWIEKEVIGPLTNEAFDERRKELNIEDVKFTIVYSDLE